MTFDQFWCSWADLSSESTRGKALPALARPVRSAWQADGEEILLSCDVTLPRHPGAGGDPIIRALRGSRAWVQDVVGGFEEVCEVERPGDAAKKQVV